MPENSSNDVKGRPEHRAVGAAAGESVAEQNSFPRVSIPRRSGETALVIAPIPGLIVSLLAAFVVWSTLRIILPVFELPEHLRELSGNAPEAQQKELLEASVVNRNKNATLSLVLLASTLGLFLTVAELCLRRQRLRALWGGLLAVLIAGVVAIGGGIAGAAMFSSSILSEYPLAKTMVVQCTMLGVMAIGVGFVVSLPILRLRLLATCVAGSLLGGLLAALVFPLMVSVLFPSMRTEVLIPDPGIGRLLWLGLAAGLIGLTITGLAKEEKRKEQDEAVSHA